MTREKPLTSVQKMVLEFLRQFHADNDQLPPAQVISDKFGWASSNSAMEMCKRLESAGEIKRNALGKWMFVRKQP